MTTDTFEVVRADIHVATDKLVGEYERSARWIAELQAELSAAQSQRTKLAAALDADPKAVPIPPDKQKLTPWIRKALKVSTGQLRARIQSLSPWGVCRFYEAYHKQATLASLRVTADVRALAKGEFPTTDGKTATLYWAAEGPFATIWERAKKMSYRELYLAGLVEYEAIRSEPSLPSRPYKMMKLGAGKYMLKFVAPEKQEAALIDAASFLAGAPTPPSPDAR